MNCGLLGRKLSHSYSPRIHADLGEYPYGLFEREPEQVEEFLKFGDFTGLNVTIPYKRSVIPYCAELSPTAQKLGAVNTIIRREDGGLIGHNTDYFGFQFTIGKTGLSVCEKKALVLGSGGASVTAKAVLAELGAKVVTISRTGEDHYGNLHKHADAALIVNATPVGMYPDVDASPVCLDGFPSLEGVIDLIYNPAHTGLLMQAQQRGLVAQNGLWMLVAQAKESAEWFTGQKIPDDIIPTIHRKLTQTMQNIVLIGMPGSGKTTVGKLLASKLGKSFVDADAYLETKAGKTIPEIFSQQGEAEFRNLEAKVLAALGMGSGLVIATGGGCVTRMENYPHLHRNGKIFWLQRKLDDLPTDGRPLSQCSSLSKMFQVREPLYKAFSDCIIRNDGKPEDAVNAILSQLQWEE